MISVVIPAFNEEQRLPATLDRIVAYFRSQALPFEVIVVNDGSQDRTGAVVSACMAASPEVRLIEHDSNHGKGFAVQIGLLAARGDTWLFSDADLATPIEEVVALRAALDAGADLAMASRAHPESRLEVPQSLMRRTLGRCFNLAVRTMLWVPYRDTQCGFKMLRATTMRGIVERLRTPHFGFDFELVYRAHRSGRVVREVPTSWRDQAGSKVRVFRDGLVMLASLWRIRWMVAREESAGSRA